MHIIHSMLLASALATPLPPFEAPPALAAGRCANHCPRKLPRPVRTGPPREKMGPPVPPLMCRVLPNGSIEKCGWKINNFVSGLTKTPAMPIGTSARLPQVTLT